MEWLDIVDANDQVIGRDTRARVHALGHLHRSSHIMLFNSRSEVFVQLRSARKDTGAGLWDTSAAGHVDSGESYLQCAIRELHEELGVATDESALQLVGQLPPRASTGHEFTQVFRLVSDQSLVLQQEEIDDGRWLSVTKLNQWLSDEPESFTNTFKIIWPMITALPPMQ